MRSALLIAVGLLPAACAPSLPETTDLYGFWAVEDAGEWRAFEFAETLPDDDLAGLSPVYQTYTYPVGEAPIERHRGGYSIGEGVIDWTVTWADDATEIGEELSNSIDSWDGESLGISGGNDNRSFVLEKMSELP